MAMLQTGLGNNQPAAISTEKAAKALFTSHQEQKRHEKIWNY